MKHGIYLSVLSTTLSLLSVLVTPILVYINYSLVGTPEPLERLETNFRFAPFIYFALILGGVSCGIFGFASRPRKRLAIFLSVSGLVVAVLSLIFFANYMVSLFGSVE